jgi:hypothetical protein
LKQKENNLERLTEKCVGEKKRTQVGKVNEKEVWDTDEGYGQRQ